MNKKIAQNWYYILGALIMLLLALHYTGVFKASTENIDTENTEFTEEEIGLIEKVAELELEEAKEFTQPVTIDTTGYQTTASGLMYKPIEQGTGIEHPTAQSNVTVHYTGTLADGTVFDSSVERGTPSSFGLNQVIRGWTEGLQLMVEGDTYDFIIPSDLAYGPSSGGHPLGGKALLFRVELLEIN